MIYLVRETDIVILAIGLRADKAAYAEADRALGEPLPKVPNRQR